MTSQLVRLAGEAWAFRARVEQEAELRFNRLAGAIAGFDPASPAVPLMRRAAQDERRHAQLCAELAAAYGQSVDETSSAADIAPRELGLRDAVLYEVVASCCITETESVATLATLLAEKAEPRVRAVLHEIARDEVIHGRMGWAHLAREASFRDVSFLSVWVPVMLSGTVADGFFSRQPAAAEAEELLRHGVLPHFRKRELFTRTLLDVIIPGLEKFGVDGRPARTWLEQRATEPA